MQPRPLKWLTNRYGRHIGILWARLNRITPIRNLSGMGAYFGENRRVLIAAWSVNHGPEDCRKSMDSNGHAPLANCNNLLKVPVL